MPKNCDGWCLPVYIYLVLAIIGVVLNFLRPPFILTNKLWATGIQILFAAFWTWLLFYLCKMCKENWSWLILLLPFLLGLIFVFVIPIIVDLVRGRPLDIAGRLQNVVGVSEEAIRRQMQQPDGVQPSDVLKSDLQRFQRGGGLDLSTAQTVAGGALSAGGFDAAPDSGFRPY